MVVADDVKEISDRHEITDIDLDDVRYVKLIENAPEGTRNTLNSFVLIDGKWYVPQRMLEVKEWAVYIPISNSRNLKRNLISEDPIPRRSKVRVSGDALDVPQ